MRIEKPDCWNVSEMPSDVADIVVNLDRWFTEHVEPLNKLLADGVEVTGYLPDCENSHHYFDSCGCEVRTKGHTHKALLIKIQPICKETAEDVLRELIDLKIPVVHEENDVDKLIKINKLKKRAKKVLEQKDE